MKTFLKVLIVGTVSACFSVASAANREACGQVLADTAQADLEVLPLLRVTDEVGIESPEKFADKALDASTAFSNVLRFVGNFVYEPSKSKQNYKLIDQQTQALRRFGADLGFDLSSRILTHDEIFIFYGHVNSELVPHTPHYDANGHRAILTYTDKLKRDRAHWARVIAHELIHSVSDRAATIPEADSNVTARLDHLGFYLTGMGRYSGEHFNEGLTELTNLMVISQYWKNEPELAELGERILQDKALKKASTPWALLVFVDALIEDIARRTERSHAEILREFQRTMLSDPRQGLRLLMEVYGREGFQEILSLTHSAYLNPELDRARRASDAAFEQAWRQALRKSLFKTALDLELNEDSQKNIAAAFHEKFGLKHLFLFQRQGE